MDAGSWIRAIPRLSLSLELLRAPVNWIRARENKISVPVLIIDVKFKHMRKLLEKRSAALTLGQLIQESDDFVPAHIRLGDRDIPVKLRLKGDMTDHIERGRWAFRIHVKGDDHIFGKRRFSLHHPQGRDYHLEPLFFDILRHEDILVPQYDFVDVILNGDFLGRMAMEEHFSTELLESQKRRESVIVKFDESLVWAAKDGSHQGFLGAFDNYANTTISPFRHSKIIKSPELADNLRLATGLLRAFVEGQLPPSKAFDAKKLGQFVAIAETFGSWHSLAWNNLRFYYNPITAMLEPIAYDAWARHPMSPQQLVEHRDPIVRAWLMDSAVWESYIHALEKMAQEFEGSSLENFLRQREQRYLHILHYYYPLLRPFDFGAVIVRARQLLQHIQLEGGLPLPDYPKFLHTHLVQDSQGSYVEIANATPEPVRILSIEWMSPEKKERTPIHFRSPLNLPFEIPGTPHRTIPQRIQIDYRNQSTEETVNPTLLISFEVANQRKIHKEIATPYFPLLKESPIPDTSVSHLLAKHSFLIWDDKNQNLIVKKGTWNVTESLVLPRRISLTIQPGTRLQFSSRASIIARGPTFFMGTAQDPIHLEGFADKAKPTTWQGVAVLQAQAQSEWSNVTVRNTTGINHKGWRLSGGVTFYESESHLDHCQFLGNKSEDALNIIRAKFTLSDIEITDALSDGLDADFAQGLIQRGFFQHIGKVGGGDAIDVSGSQIQVEGTTLLDIWDKGLSVGERSTLTARSLTITDALVGAASKDGSRLMLSNSDFKNIRQIGLMAYIKKPEYGAGSITAEHVTFQNVVQAAKAQKGNSIRIDGQEVASEDLDVDTLYKTTMKPGRHR